METEAFPDGQPRGPELETLFESVLLLLTIGIYRLSKVDIESSASTAITIPAAASGRSRGHTLTTYGVPSLKEHCSHSHSQRIIFGLEGQLPASAPQRVTE